MKKKGFTLVEIMIVVIIIGILAAIALPRYVSSTRQAKQNSCDANVSNLNSQWELKFLQSNYTSWPTYSELTADTRYFPEGSPICPYNPATTAYTDAGGDNRVDYHTHT